MQKQMTISVEEDVYNALAPLMAKKALGAYISNLVRSQTKIPSLEEEYKAMAADTEREKEAQEWCNAYFGPEANRACPGAVSGGSNSTPPSDRKFEKRGRQ
jgi:hypothetical protein